MSIIYKGTEKFYHSAPYKIKPSNKTSEFLGERAS